MQIGIVGQERSHPLPIVAKRTPSYTKFTFDAQKDMEQQLQTITKEVLRREHR